MSKANNTKQTNKLIDRKIDCKVAYGDACFAMTIKRMEIDSLKDLSLEACIRKLMNYKYYDLSYKEVYYNMVKASTSKIILYNTFTTTCDMIGILEKAIFKYITRSKDKKINISLPTLLLDPSINTAIVYEPAALYLACESLITYMNNLNIASIYKSIPKIEHTASIPVKLDKKQTFPCLKIDEGLTTAKARDQLASLYNRELVIMQYLYSVEEYQYQELQALYRIQEIINDICLGLAK